MRLASIDGIVELDDGQLRVTKLDLPLLVEVIGHGDLRALILDELVFIRRPTEGLQSILAHLVGVRSDEPERFQHFSHQQGIIFRRNAVPTNVVIDVTGEKLNEIVILVETAEGVVQIQCWTAFAENDRLVEARGQAASIAQIVQSLLFGVGLVLDRHHFCPLGLFEERLEDSHRIVRSLRDAFLHEVEDRLQFVGLDQIDQQKAKLVRSSCLLLQQLALVLLLPVQSEVLAGVEILSLVVPDQGELFALDDRAQHFETLVFLARTPRAVAHENLHVHVELVENHLLRLFGEVQPEVVGVELETLPGAPGGRRTSDDRQDLRIGHGGANDRTSEGSRTLLRLAAARVRRRTFLIERSRRRLGTTGGIIRAELVDSTGSSYVTSNTNISLSLSLSARRSSSSLTSFVRLVIIII